MSDALGLSIGTTNVVAARPGRMPVSRRSVLTLWENRPAEIGVPSQNPELTSPNLTAPGVVLRGFIERVGDPVPLVATDGSAHRGEVLLATGLDALARAVETGEAPGPVMIAVPAYWGPAAIGALRGALRDSPSLSPGGVPPMIISDATAALAALQTNPGLPARGVVALCDFGGSGTSITLADAGANLAPIGETLRFSEFSGDQIDQALLNHVLAGIRSAGPDDTSGTAAVGPLTRLREECRLAKERLSTETATVVPVDLPGNRSEIRLTRAELESVIAPALAGFLDALGDALEHNRIPAATLAAVGTVGGGAAIPVISQQLSEALRVPVITSPGPALTVAAGAALLAARGSAPDAPTSLGVSAADAPTSLAPAAWASSTAGQAAGESASDGSPSATYRALAWSQDDDATEEPVPYAGEDYSPRPEYGAPPPTGARPMVEFDTDEHGTGVVAPPLPWYRRPALLFGLSAALAAVMVGGLALKLTDSDSTPTTTTTRVTKPGEDLGTPAPPPPVPQTVTVTGDNGQTTVTTVTPTTTVAPTSESSSSSSTSTTTPPTTTTTTTTTPTTTTTTTTPTTTTTTTVPTTTTTTTTRTTTTVPTTTSIEPPPTTKPVPSTATEFTTGPETPPPPVTEQAVVPEAPAAATTPGPLE